MRQSIERYFVVFGVLLVALTFLLILDIQTGLDLSGKYLPAQKAIEEPDSARKEHTNFASNHDKQAKSGNDDGKIEEFDPFATFKQNFWFQ